MWNFASRVRKQKRCYSQCQTLRVGFRSKCRAAHNVKLWESGAFKAKTVLLNVNILGVGIFQSKNRATRNVKLCESGASEAKTVLLTMLNFASRELPKQKPCRMLNFASGELPKQQKRATHNVKLCESGASEAKAVLLTMANIAGWELPKQKPRHSQGQTLRVGSFRSENPATHNVKLCESGASETALTMLHFASQELPKQKRARLLTRLWAAIAPR